MPTKTNQYDLTAYLIARDAINVQHPLYEITEGSPNIFETGRINDDIKDKSTYME